MPTLLRCFLLFFFAVGLLILLAAAWLFVDVQRFARKAVSVTGTVVAVQAEDARSEMEGMPARDITLHRPVVRFQTAQGQMIQFTASFATGAPLYVVGEQVQVLYPGGMPSKARIQHPGLRSGAPLLLALMGMGFCLIAACVHRLCVRYWPILLGPRDGACG